MTSSILARLLNMSTGPVEVTARVLNTQLDSFLSPHCPEFWQLHDATHQLLRRLLRTEGDALAFHGSIRTGLDVGIASVTGPGVEVLAVSNGYWGDLMGQIAESCGAGVIRVSQPPLRPVDPEAVSRALRANPGVDVVTVVHVETNSGVLNPIEEIGRVVAEQGALYVVDTACSAGAIPLETDRWGIDIGITGSHKCLAAIPGLAVLTVGARAWTVIRQRQSPGSAARYYNLPGWFERTVMRKAAPPYTQPTSLFRALHAALSELDEIGQERWFALHREAAMTFREGLHAIGLRLLPEEKDPGDVALSTKSLSDTVFAVAYPEEVDDERFRLMMRDDYGIFVIGNIGGFAGRSFRVGLMSPPQIERRNVLATLESVSRAIAACKR